MGSYDLWDAWQDQIQNRRRDKLHHQIDIKNQRIAANLVPPGPIGPLHPAHRVPPHPAETAPPTSCTPFLRLPTELHLEIFRHSRTDEDLYDGPHAGLWVVFALRGTSSRFRHMVPPLTHAELLHLELTIRATSEGLQACRYCLRLRHKDHFSQLQNRHRGVPIEAVLGWSGYEAKSRETRMKRFCLDCGFAKAIKPGIEIKTSRYAKGTELVVGDDERWVWCRWCGELKKGGDAGTRGLSACRGSCAACCKHHKHSGACVQKTNKVKRATVKRQEVLDEKATKTGEGGEE